MSCTKAPPPPDLAKEARTKEVSAVRDAVFEKLRDPASATFKNVVRVVTGADPAAGKVGVPVYCGEVNAKNAYGGYVGYQRFFVFDSLALIGTTDLPDPVGYKVFCIGSGEPVDLNQPPQEPKTVR